MTTIDRIFKMDNPIQPYAWGSRTDIARLMGRSFPTPQPEAEMWMGAHANAPSKIWYEDRWESLNQLITQYPQEMLGGQVSEQFNGTLPYLFKVLAAGEPLSIQAHPDRKQAREGYHRENLKNIAIGAPNRNYKDDQHKPECLCALTPFWGLCGFRPLTEMMNIIKPVWPQKFNHMLTVLAQSLNPNGLQGFFQQLMNLENQQRNKLVSLIVDNALRLKKENNAYEWIVTLNNRYPNDIGVLSPMLLNLIKLAPGEAIFLPARQLHAYLGGLGIELMANSDNVLRGGLTPKYMDVEELIAILDFNSFHPKKLTHHGQHDTEKAYESSVEEFFLSEISITDNKPFHLSQRFAGPEIILCVEGSAKISKPDNQQVVDIPQGKSVFVPSLVDNYAIRGNARLFKANVNIQQESVNLNSSI